MIDKKLKISIITGSLLGIICIIMGFANNGLYLFALWYNRLIMGILIGLTKIKAGSKGLIKGAVLGALVSFAFYLSTGMTDLISFLAGIVYGVIIILVVRKFAS